jgi:hypothetical protein
MPSIYAISACMSMQAPGAARLLREEVWGIPLGEDVLADGLSGISTFRRFFDDEIRAPSWDFVGWEGHETS